MNGLVLVAVLCLGVCLVQAGFKPHLERQGGKKQSTPPDPKEDPEFEQQWAYVEVRPGAHMFYWLYYTDHEDGYLNRPVVIWLQGGPGASSTGYGNFDIIGPRTIELDYRNTTWAHQASILFIDNPVGAGYSYVEHDDLYTRDVDEIATDLMALWTVFLETNPEFVDVPLYIFGQSYGGKMGVVFAQYLHNAISNDGFASTLGGIAMGNAWISPVDSTITWAPFLYWMSTTDEQGVEAIMGPANQCKDAAEAGNWNAATQFWKLSEAAVALHTNRVDFYNILKFNVVSGTKEANPKHVSHQENKKRRKHARLSEELYKLLVDPTPFDELDDLMNGEVKEYLEIIPEEVVHGGQSGDVFYYQEGDFMKPVVENVDWMLQNTDVDVIVYQGQLDLICDTKAAHDFVLMLEWEDLDNYLYAERVPLVEPWTRQTDTFVKAYQQFKFYWNLRAGHAVPKDDAEAAYRMLERILGKVDT